MQDKSNNNEEEFSLNHFDLADKKENSDHTEADDFNALIGGEDIFESDKHAPIVPDALESTDNSSVTDEIDSFTDSGSGFDAAGIEQPLIAADMDHLDDVYALDDEQSAQEESGNRLVPIFAVLAVIIVALVAWMNMGDDDEAVDDQQFSRPVLGEDVQMQRTERKLLEMQERLASMQERLSTKDKQIAELTHLVAEQAIQQKKIAVKKSASAVKKQVKQPVASFQPITSTRKVVKKKPTGWVIVIASVATRAAANKALKGLKANGVHAEVKPTMVKGKPWFRIRVSGFSSRQEANVKKAYLEKQHGIKGTWIHKPG